MELTVASIQPEHEERRVALLRQAFGGTTAYDPAAPVLDPEQLVGAFAAGELVGAAATLGFEMTWGGRAVPCGGVSGVVVAPEARGRRAAQRMLAESFDRMAGRGQVISALYPTTASLYRTVGFEVVGTFERRFVPLGALPADAGELRWRRAELDDPARRSVHDAMAARHDGWFRVDPRWWEIGAWRAGQEPGTNRFLYVGSRGGADVAVVQYRYGTSEASMYRLEVEAIAGVDHAAVGAGLGFLAAHGTTADGITTALPRPLLAAHLPQIQRTQVSSSWPWMLRLVDVPGAVQARGFPAVVAGRMDLDVFDPLRPANGGRHVLEVDAGAGTLVRGGTGQVQVSVQDLAVVYAGGDVRALADAGRLPGASAADLDLLAAAFVSNPTIPLFF